MPASTSLRTSVIAQSTRPRPNARRSGAPCAFRQRWEQARSPVHSRYPDRWGHHAGRHSREVSSAQQAERLAAAAAAPPNELMRLKHLLNRAVAAISRVARSSHQEDEGGPGPRAVSDGGRTRCSRTAGDRDGVRWPHVDYSARAGPALRLYRGRVADRRAPGEPLSLDGAVDMSAHGDVSADEER
jgi:hypothetical protein